MQTRAVVAVMLSSSLSSSIFVSRCILLALDAADCSYWRRMLFGVAASSYCDVYTAISALISSLAHC